MEPRRALAFDELDMQPLEALVPRDRILRTASDLFYRFSIHTVGIDRIIAESGVAKMTFYKHFPSKADLVATYLRHKNGIWLGMLASSTERTDLSPLERILAVFDILEESFRAPTFRGCPFVNGMAEFGPEVNSPDVQATIGAYFEGLRELVASLVEPLNLEDPRKAVIQILTLIEGSIIMAQSMGDPAIARANRDAAQLLLDRAMG